MTICKHCGQEIKVYEVAIIESEKGWGQKTDEIKKFDSEILADEFIKGFNSENTDETTPDWYMYAKKHNSKEK